MKKRYQDKTNVTMDYRFLYNSDIMQMLCLTFVQCTSCFLYNIKIRNPKFKLDTRKNSIYMLNIQQVVALKRQATTHRLNTRKHGWMMIGERKSNRLEKDWVIMKRDRKTIHCARTCPAGILYIFKSINLILDVIYPEK